MTTSCADCENMPLNGELCPWQNTDGLFAAAEQAFGALVGALPPDDSVQGKAKNALRRVLLKMWKIQDDKLED